jgi:hypothetical protein
MILARMKDAETEIPRADLPFRIVVRESTARTGATYDTD